MYKLKSKLVEMAIITPTLYLYIYQSINQSIMPSFQNKIKTLTNSKTKKNY